MMNEEPPAKKARAEPDAKTDAEPKIKGMPRSKAAVFYATGCSGASGAERPSFDEKVKRAANGVKVCDCVLVAVSSTGGATNEDSVFERVYLVPGHKLGDMRPFWTDGGGCRWWSYNYRDEFAAGWPELFAAIKDDEDTEDNPHKLGSLKENPEMATWLARTTLKDIIMIDGNWW